jgi:hypothetical protein
MGSKGMALCLSQSLGLCSLFGEPLPPTLLTCHGLMREVLFGQLLAKGVLLHFDCVDYESRRLVLHYKSNTISELACKPLAE